MFEGGRDRCAGPEDLSFISRDPAQGDSNDTLIPPLPYAREGCPLPCTSPPHSRWIVAAPAPGPHATPTRARAGSKAAPRAPAAIQAICLLRRLPDAVTLEAPLEDTEGSSHWGRRGPGKNRYESMGQGVYPAQVEQGYK